MFLMLLPVRGYLLEKLKVFDITIRDINFYFLCMGYKFFYSILNRFTKQRSLECHSSTFGQLYPHYKAKARDNSWYPIMLPNSHIKMNV